MTSDQVKAIEKFQVALQKKVTAAEKKCFSSTKIYEMYKTEISLEYGRKYCKVVKKSGVSNSVHCFIEIATGDIYKAATYLAPAKHVRGNINTPDCGMSAVTEYGANYIR